MKPLVRIFRPQEKLTQIAQTIAFYNPDRIVTIYQLPKGGNVSCELSHGWVEYWYEGDYRKETEFWPLSKSQYLEI